MSRSVHTSRPKFRKAFRNDYSSDKERTRGLGKIIDEIGLKRTMKANARLKKQGQKIGVKHSQVYFEQRSAASKRTPPSDSEEAKQLVKKQDRKGYG